MKKRLLKKVVRRMRPDSPARFRYNEKVKAAWIRWHNELSPSPRPPLDRSFYYDIDPKGNLIPCGLWQWAYLFEYQTARRMICKTDLGDCWVSTVFLGTDNSWGGDVPIVFESMIFGGPLDREQQRYASRREAEEGHKAMVKMCEERHG